MSALAEMILERDTAGIFGEVVGTGEGPMMVSEAVADERAGFSHPMSGDALARAAWSVHASTKLAA